MGAMDAWAWLSLALLPIWIGLWAAALRALLDWSMRPGWLRFPIYMGLGIPAAIIMAGVPVSMLARQMSRYDVYTSCVHFGNARDPLNGCPQWTLDKLDALAVSK